MFEARTIFRPRDIATPFGKAEFGGVEIPPLKLPTLSESHKRAFAHTLGIEGTRLIGMIPYVGEWIANNVGAMHAHEIKKILTPEEFEKYMRWDRVYPDAIAFLRSRIGR